MTPEVSRINSGCSRSLDAPLRCLHGNREVAGPGQSYQYVPLLLPPSLDAWVAPETVASVYVRDSQDNRDLKEYLSPQRPSQPGDAPLLADECLGSVEGQFFEATPNTLTAWLGATFVASPTMLEGVHVDEVAVATTRGQPWPVGTTYPRIDGGNVAAGAPAHVQSFREPSPARGRPDVEARTAPGDRCEEELSACLNRLPVLHTKEFVTSVAIPFQAAAREKQFLGGTCLPTSVLSNDKKECPATDVLLNGFIDTHPYEEILSQHEPIGLPQACRPDLARAADALAAAAPTPPPPPPADARATAHVGKALQVAAAETPSRAEAPVEAPVKIADAAEGEAKGPSESTRILEDTPESCVEVLTHVSGMRVPKQCLDSFVHAPRRARRCALLTWLGRSCPDKRSEDIENTLAAHEYKIVAPALPPTSSNFFSEKDQSEARFSRCPETGRSPIYTAQHSGDSALSCGAPDFPACTLTSAWTTDALLHQAAATANTPHTAFQSVEVTRAASGSIACDSASRKPAAPIADAPFASSLVTAPLWKGVADGSGSATSFTGDVAGRLLVPTKSVIFANRKAVFYKTRMCYRLNNNGRCPVGDKCTFAHSEDELRPPPLLNKTRMCPSLIIPGKPCPAVNSTADIDDQSWRPAASASSAECRFAHSREELRYTVSMFKTNLCLKWSRGKCKVSNKSPFNKHTAACLSGVNVYDWLLKPVLVLHGECYP